MPFSFVLDNGALAGGVVGPRVISSGQNSIKFQINGTLAQANFMLAVLNYSQVSVSVLNAFSLLGDAGIRVNFAKLDGSIAGLFIGDKLNNNGSLINTWKKWDGSITIDLNKVKALGATSGASYGQRGEAATILAHEILHAVFGGHGWGSGAPASASVVRNDPMYRAGIDLAADFHLSIGVGSDLYGLSYGQRVVSERGLNRSNYSIQHDNNNNRDYYEISNGSSTARYYIVSHDEYSMISATSSYRAIKRRADMKAAQRRFHGGNDVAGNELDAVDFRFAGNAQEAAEADRALGEAARAYKSATYSQLGSIVGSSLGTYLGEGNSIKGILYSSLLGKIGERLGAALGSGNLAEAVTPLATANGLASFGNDVAVRAGQAAIGRVTGPERVRRRTLHHGRFNRNKPRHFQPARLHPGSDEALEWHGRSQDRRRRTFGHDWRGP
jgi:hypothetical protein